MKKFAILFILLTVLLFTSCGIYTPKITIDLSDYGKEVLLFSSEFFFDSFEDELGEYTINNPHTEMVEVASEYSGNILTDVRLNDFHLSIEVTDVDLKDVQSIEATLYLSENGYESQTYNVVKNVTLLNGNNTYGLWASDSPVLMDLLNFINSNNTTITLYIVLDNNYSGSAVPSGNISVYVDKITFQAKIGG
ncbi:MAG: hypothetical protein PWQ77_47 [Kosmotogales bacterium]|nr:hypothetical protein [Kosmotogales bacterium]